MADTRPIFRFGRQVVAALKLEDYEWEEPAISRLNAAERATMLFVLFRSDRQRQPQVHMFTEGRHLDLQHLLLFEKVNRCIEPLTRLDPNSLGVPGHMRLSLLRGRKQRKVCASLDWPQSLMDLVVHRFAQVSLLKLGALYKIAEGFRVEKSADALWENIDLYINRPMWGVAHLVDLEVKSKDGRRFVVLR